MPDLDQVLAPPTSVPATREVLHGELVVRSDGRYVRVDDRNALWGPVRGGDGVGEGDDVAIAIAQDSTPYVVYPGGGGGGSDVDVNATATARSLAVGAAATADVTEPAPNLFAFDFGIPIGATGAQGPQGANGAQGAPGAQGPKGDTGAQGPQGVKGDKGDKGDTGYDAGPIGTVLTWSGATMPDGYVLANGARFTQAEFPQGYDFALAQVAAGSPFWTVRAGDLTFTVPDFRDSFLYAPGAKAVGARGGQAAPTMPAHTTGTESADHTHVTSYAVWNSAAGASGIAPGGSYGLAQSPTGGRSAAHTHSAAGVGDPVEGNLPPYVVVAQVVKLRGVSVSAGAIVGPPGPPGPVGNPTIRVRGQRTTDVALGAGYVPLSFDETEDTDAGWNGTRFQPTRPGYYRLTALATLSGGGAGMPQLAIVKNGPYSASGTNAIAQGWTLLSGGWGTMFCSGRAYFNGTTDYAEVWWWTGAGASLRGTGGNTSTFEAESIGAAGPKGDTGATGPAGTGTPPRVTVLPSSPGDGQECVFVADAANGVLWHLKYNAGSAAAYKWELVGGSPITTQKTALDTINATPVSAYADLPTTGNGLNITAPLAGDYLIEASAQIDQTADGQQVSLGIKVGAAAAFEIINHRTGNWVADHRKQRFNVPAAATVIKPQAATTIAGGRIFTVNLHLIPVRVG